MRGIIIAGGQGTRLLPLTSARPKPLLPIVNAPLLRYQLHYLAAAGITKICFATNHLSDQIENRFGPGDELGLEITYAVEGSPLDTGGAIRNAFDSMPADDCIILNGDVIHSFDLGEIIQKHAQRAADVTIVVREVTTPHPYGVVSIGENDTITGFAEPTEEQKRSFETTSAPGQTEFMNAGIYVINAEILHEFPIGKSKVETDVFPKLIAEGKKLLADRQNGFWVDVGRPKQYLEAVRGVVAGLTPSPNHFPPRGDSAVNLTADIAPTAAVTGNCSIAAGVVVEPGAVVERSVILYDSVVGQNSRVEGCIIDERVEIGQNCVLRNVVIGADEEVPDGAEMEGNVL